jgi:hypothetical protein
MEGQRVFEREEPKRIASWRFSWVIYLQNPETSLTTRQISAPSM